RAFIGANLYILSPGSPFIYYGEEIGLKGSRGSENTDANRRLAMLWGDDDTISDPEGSTYLRSKQVNGTVADQKKNDSSLLNHYIRLIKIRNKYPEIARGTYSQLKLGNKNLGGFVIQYNGETTYLVHNNSDSEITVETDMFEKIADQIGMNKATLNGNTLTVGAYTSVILK
ncbi:MAG: hypothetical protein J6S38_03280, partial [Erysipelotrichaceae bacterium]|nr:hypothetical protein [Erysipelotrichaceae bacterium]